MLMEGKQYGWKVHWFLINNTPEWKCFFILLPNTRILFLQKHFRTLTAIYVYTLCTRLNLYLIARDEPFNPDYSTCATVVCAQIMRSQCGVQTRAVSNEPSITFVPPVGGHKEPGQDCAAGGCAPRPHGGGEGSAAGQRLHRDQGWRWRYGVTLHCLWVRGNTRMHLSP